MRTSLTRVAAGTAIAAAAVLAVAGTASAATGSPAAKAPTALSIAEAKATIKAGQKDIIGGFLRSGKAPLAGQVVWLDRIAGSNVIPLQHGLTARNGGVEFTVAPGSTTRYVLVFAGTKKLAATHSFSETVVVKR